MEPPVEDKIVLDTILKYMVSSGKWITLESIIAAVAESYQKGLEIGWETKVLDGLNDALRSLVNKT